MDIEKLLDETKDRNKKTITHEGKEIKLEMEFDGKNYYIPIFGGVLPYKN